MSNVNTIGALSNEINLLTAQRVPIGNVEIDYKANVREPDGSTYDVEAMADDLALTGQKVATLVEKRKNGKYYPLRGFRRCSGIKLNAQRGVIDPTTGKPFSDVLAYVIERELSEKERVALMLDAGNTKTLTKAEVFLAVERGSKVWDKREDLAMALRGSLDERFPPKVKAEEINDPKAYTKYRTGLLDNFLNAINSPTVVRDAYFAKIKDKQSWPLDAEVRMFKKVYDKEADADKSRKINRQKPGPEFQKTWDEYVAKKMAAVAEGKKPKAQSSMNKEDMESAQKAMDSRIGKLFFDVATRKIGQDKLATLDALLVDFESGKQFTKEQIATVLDNLTA